MDTQFSDTAMPHGPSAQLKKLELIRLLSEQMLKRKRLGREIRTRGIKGNIRSIYSSEYNLTDPTVKALFEQKMYCKQHLSAVFLVFS